jgi:hypothetical protein
MALRPFSPRMFPCAVVVFDSAYPKGETGGSSRADGTGLAMQACVQLAVNSTDKLERIHEDDGLAAGGLTHYDVTFPVDPAVKADDTIVFGAITMICNGPAAPVFPYALWRVRCQSKT